MTLPLNSGTKFGMGQWIAWWTCLPAEGNSSRGNFVCCFIIVVIFLGLGGAYRFGWGEDFIVIIWEASYKGMEQFYGVSWPQCKDSNLTVGWGTDWSSFYILYNYARTISFLVKILLLKLKNLYTQYAWISFMKIRNGNQDVKVEKIVVFVKTFALYHQF